MDIRGIKIEPEDIPELGRLLAQWTEPDTALCAEIESEGTEHSLAVHGDGAPHTDCAECCTIAKRLAIALGFPPELLRWILRKGIEPPEHLKYMFNMMATEDDSAVEEPNNENTTSPWD